MIIDPSADLSSASGFSSADQGARHGGFALILVLWVLTLISLIIAGFLSTTRSETRTLIARSDQAEAEALADGAVFWAIGQLLTINYEAEGPQSAIAVNGTPRRVQIDDAEISIAVQDAGGLVDLNAADEILMRSLLISMGESPDRADILAARIADFRDSDDRPRPFGAEDADYRAAGLAYESRDAPMIQFEELLQIPGMTHDLVLRLSQVATVQSGGRAVDPTSAPPDVLAAIPGLSEGERAAYASGTIISLADRAASAPNPYLTGPARSIFHITSTARTPGNGLFQRRAVVQLSGGTERYRIRSWQQGMILESESTSGF
ncbi:type II secretion system protein K [alpha proteobacterium Q-1]|nr:type II secretion system protein K [alpha proteobacterium Q-1]